MSNKNTPSKKASTTKAAAKKKPAQKKNAQKKAIPKKAVPAKSVAKKAAATQDTSSSATPVKKKAGRPPKSATPKKVIPALPEYTVSGPTNAAPTGIELPSATSTTAATGSVADSVVMSLSWQKNTAKPTKWQRFKNFFRPASRKKKF